MRRERERESSADRKIPVMQTPGEGLFIHSTWLQFKCKNFRMCPFYADFPLLVLLYTTRITYLAVSHLLT